MPMTRSRLLWGRSIVGRGLPERPPRNILRAFVQRLRPQLQFELLELICGQVDPRRAPFPSPRAARKASRFFLMA